MRNFLIFALLLVAGLTFAQFGGTPGQKIMDCQMSCCDAYGGVWEEDGCSLDYESGELEAYSACVEECVKGVSAEEGWENGTGNVVCCGSAFMVLALVSFIALRR